MVLNRLAVSIVLFLASSVPMLLEAQQPTPTGASRDRLPPGAILRFGSTRLTHATWLTSLEFSRDDRRLATADSSGVVRLWDVATGRLVWEKPKGTGRKLALSPDGKILAISGFYSPQITLWDLEQDREIRQLSQNARSLTFSPDGNLLIAGGKDKIVRIWNRRTGKLIRQLAGHQAELFAVAISPDGRRIASGGGQRGNSLHNEIRIWDTRTGRSIARLEDDDQRLKQLPDTIYSLEFSADGKRLAAAGPYVVRIWDAEHRRLNHRLAKSTYDVAMSPSTNHLATPGDFGIYDIGTGKQVRKLEGDVSVYGQVDYAHDGKLITSSNMEGRIQLWDAETGKEIMRRRGHKEGIRSVAFAPSGAIVASVSRKDATIRVWGAASGTQLYRIPITWRGPDVWWNEEGSSIFIPSYGRELMSWTYDSTIHFWRLGDFEPRIVRLGTQSATAVTFSADGSRAAIAIYTGGPKNTVDVYELDGGRLIATLAPSIGKTRSEMWISALAFSPDGNLLAIGALGDSLRDTPATSVQLWNISRRELVRQLRPAVAPPGAIRFSPDGSLLATSAVRGCSLQVWRASDGTQVHSFDVKADAHGRDPAPIAFSPDGRLLAAADVNREIYVWELTAEEKIHTFRGHEKAVTSLAFSPDGKTLLSGSEDATLLLWSISPVDSAQTKLTSRQLDDCWRALREPDAETAATAASRLIGSPQQTVELFRKRLLPIDLHDPKELPRLIRQLASADQKQSLTAAVDLKAFGKSAAPALFEALAQQDNPEIRRRIEQVLAVAGKYDMPPETLRRIRAIGVLEQIATDEAIAVLQRIADANPPVDAGENAKAAIERIRQLRRRSKRRR